MKVVHCIDCKHFQCWRSGEVALIYGKGAECKLNIITCPNDYDFCSRGESIIRCKSCGKRFDYTAPNYCPDCGAKMIESEDEA